MYASLRLPAAVAVTLVLAAGTADCGASDLPAPAQLGADGAVTPPAPDAGGEASTPPPAPASGESELVAEVPHDIDDVAVDDTGAYLLTGDGSQPSEVFQVALSPSAQGAPAQPRKLADGARFLPTAIARDADHVIFSESGPGTGLYVIDLDGGTTRTVDTGLDQWLIPIASDGVTITWGVRFKGEVTGSIALTGGARGPGYALPEQRALNSVLRGGAFYYLAESAGTLPSYDIRRAPLAGGPADVEVATLPKQPRGLDVDTATGEIYWTDVEANAFHAAAGGAPGAFVSNSNDPPVAPSTRLDDYSVLIVGTDVYIGGPSTVRRVPRSNPSASTVLTTQPATHPRLFRANQTHVYWVEGTHTLPHQLWRHRR